MKYKTLPCPPLQTTMWHPEQEHMFFSLTTFVQGVLLPGMPFSFDLPGNFLYSQAQFSSYSLRKAPFISFTN